MIVVGVVSVWKIVDEKQRAETEKSRAEMERNARVQDVPHFSRRTVAPSSWLDMQARRSRTSSVPLQAASPAVHAGF